MKVMKLEKFIRKVGTKAEAARRIGVTPQALGNWLTRSPGEYEVTVTKDREVVKVMKLVRV